MNYNTPGVLSLNVDLGSVYTLNSPNVIITKPDGTTDTAVPTVSPSGVTSANPHKFSTLYVPSTVGQHTCRFQFLTSTFQPGQTLNSSFDFWVTWNEVFSGIRTLLGADSNGVPDSLISMELANLFSYIRMYTGTSLADYSTFTTSYQKAYDRASVFLVAAKIRPYQGGNRPSGEISLFKKGTTTVQYTSGVKGTKTIDEVWWEQGLNILEATMPEFALALATDYTGDQVGTRGPLAPGNDHPLAGWRQGSFGASNTIGGVDFD